MKRCTKCGLSKDPEDFPKNKLTSDGLGSWCKACVKINTANYFKTERGKEKLRDNAKRYYASESGKLNVKEAQKRYFATEKGKIAKFHVRFLNLYQGALKRGVTFELTESDLVNWWAETTDTCVYCGVTIEKFRQLRDAILNYKGDNWEVCRFMRFLKSPYHRAIDSMTIDRANNSIGYNLENIVKSCWFCNSLKSDFFSADEMRNIGAGVLKKLELAINEMDVEGQSKSC